MENDDFLATNMGYPGFLPASYKTAGRTETAEVDTHSHVSLYLNCFDPESD